ncbi:hypothetical protein Taro_018041, partial [Colocasia esculenta]|nr:hypothetical protein [Colocasia esculenta]
MASRSWNCYCQWSSACAPHVTRGATPA